MEIKKSPKADLEGKKGTRLLIGYVFVLAIIFVAFEWSETDKKIDLNTGIKDAVFEEEMVPITEQQPKTPPPPPAAPSVADVLKIVTNDADVQETAVASSEDAGKAVEVKYTAPVVQQKPEEDPDEQVIFQVVEQMPEYPGGMTECLKFLASNLKYPTISQENGVQGRVIVQFVVNKDGSIVDPVVVRSVDPYLDKEALRVVKSMPKWTPGKQRGKAVRVKYTLPVTFKLQ